MAENSKAENFDKWLYPIAGIILVWAIFIPGIFTGQSALAGLLEHDVGFQWIPFKEYAGWAWSRGYFPLWCPYVFAGMPFLAFSHTGVLYPLGWLLVFFNYAQAVNFYYPLHLSIGYLGLYLLCRNLGISRFSSFLAGISAVLSAKFFYFIHFLPICNSNFWGIWFFYFMVKMTRRRSAWSMLGMSLALCLELLGGDFESTAYQLFFAPWFMLILLHDRKQILSAAWLVAIIAILLGTSLALIQFLTMYEYSRFFLRSAGFTFAGFEARTLPISLLRMLVFPVTLHPVPGIQQGAPVLYLGISMIFFPLAAMVFARKNLGLFLLSLLILLFAFGSIRPLDWLVYHIPLLNRFGAQEHSFFLFQIFWAVLAGQGIDHSLDRRPKIFIWFFLLGFVLCLPPILGMKVALFRPGLLCFLGIISVLVLVLWFVRRLSAAQKLMPALLFVVFVLDLYIPAFSTLPRHSPEIFELPRPLQELQKQAGQSGARSIVVSRMGVEDDILLHHLGMRDQVGTIDGWITVPALTYAEFLDLIEPRAVEFKGGKVDRFGFNVHFRDGKFLEARTFPLIDLLSVRYFLVRGMNLKFASPYSLAIPNEFLHFKNSENWQEQVYVEKRDRFAARLESMSAPAAAFLMLTFGDDSGRHLLYARAPGSKESKEIRFSLDQFAGRTGELELRSAQVGAKSSPVFLEDPRIENPSRPLQRTHKNSLQIFENREAFPEAFIVHDCEVIADDHKLLWRLSQLSQWDLAREIILSAETPSMRVVKSVASEFKGKYIDLNQFKEPVQKIIDQPDYLAFKTYTLRPAYLFLNHQHLPGWRAYVDGREWKVERADYCFEAVFLDQGPHTIEFRFQPAGFAIGLYGSLAAGLCLLLGAGTIFASRFPRVGSRP